MKADDLGLLILQPSRFAERKRGTAFSAVPLISNTSKTVSRVLYLTVIYLGAPLPVRSSHPGSGRASLLLP